MWAGPQGSLRLAFFITNSVYPWTTHLWWLHGTHLYQSHSCLHSVKLFVNKLAASCWVLALMSRLLLVSIKPVVTLQLCNFYYVQPPLVEKQVWGEERIDPAVTGLNYPDYLLFVYLGQILHDCLPLSPSWYTKEKGQELGSAGRVKGRSWFSGKGQSAFCRSVFGRLTGLTCSSHGCLVCLGHIHTLPLSWKAQWLQHVQNKIPILIEGFFFFF